MKERMNNGSGDMTAAFSAALESASAAPAAESSPDSTPAPETTTQAPQGEATAAAIAQPETATTETVTATADTEPTGEPPAWRWQEIKENIRKKTAEETEAKVRLDVEKQYEWAKAISEQQRAQLPNALQWAEWLDRDARGAYAWLGQQLGQGPTAQPQQTTAPDPEPSPQPDQQLAIQLNDGTTIDLMDWLKRNMTPQIQREVESSEKFKHVLTHADRLEKLQQQHQAQATSQQWAQNVLAPIASQPHFGEFKADLGKALAALPETATEHQMQQAVIGKYLALLAAKHDAALKEAPSKAAAELQQRAVAGTTNPNSASTGSPKKFQPGTQGFADALAHFGADAR